MWLTLVELLVVGYLPGAVIFRMPVADRDTRARLAADERVFWATIISVAISCGVVVGLAAVGGYTLPRLIGVNIALSVALVVLARGNVRLGLVAPPPRPVAVIPVALVAVGLWLYFPPAEYILGGRDPGVYLNQGVQIAQQGSLVIPDPLVAALPARMRDLFFSVGDDGYMSRFIGFIIVNAGEGHIAGQFPQAFPASLAIGYSIDGLRGALHTTGVWAMLGVLAVYYSGTWFFGRPAATVAAGLLSLCLAQVWFARIPNSEMPTQALLFAGLLAFARMEHDRFRFFAPIAATAFGLLCFLRIDASLVLGCIAISVALCASVGRRTPNTFFVPLATASIVGFAYIATLHAQYFGAVFARVGEFTPRHWGLFALALCLGGGVLVALGRHQDIWSKRLPIGLVAGVLGLALYAYFFREPGEQLTAFNAYALRTFSAIYVTPYVLAAALAGYAIAVPRVFWKSPLMVLLTTGFCVMYFYRPRIAPEHFWMARRFVPVILPTVFLFVGAAGFYKPWPTPQTRWAVLGRLRVALAVLLVGAAGVHVVQQTRVILSHSEYAGVITKIEQLASRFGADDLIVIEPSTLSDLHVLGVPLAYIYGRNVLVLDSPTPEKAVFAEFVSWAGQHYRNIFFVGSGGTDLLSDSVDAEATGAESFSVPEYERPQDRAPRGVLQKRFEFGIYRLAAARPLKGGFELQVGGADDLYVKLFYPKESNATTAYRWSGARSEVSVRMPATAPSRLTVWASNGRRPATAPAAQMTVYLDNQFLGTLLVGVDGFLPYTFAIPAAERRAGSISVVRIDTLPWSPRRVLGVADERELGVMIHKLELR